MTFPSLKMYTLGCKVNQYETELVREALVRFGYRDAPPDHPADLCVINTCTVTAEGDSKSRQVIRRMARQNPDAKIVVMGCYATRAPEEIRSISNVTEVVTDKRELPDLLGRFGVIDFPDGITRFNDRQRAYVKVQDGCLLRCSYCVIPSVRPQMASRSMASIVSEVERLVDSGHREIVLTGIHLGHYGVDWNRNKPRGEWIRLGSLLKSLVSLSGDFRIRLSSIEATEVTRELLQVMGEHGDQICPHLHICLQSGSDSVLRRMRRRWGVKRFLDRCDLARKSLHKPAFTTDVIVGFPGETDEDFQATCDVAKLAGFSKIHAFPFSPRSGTPAFDMPDQVSKQRQTDRVAKLAEVGEALRRDYYDSLVHERLGVMIETTREGRSLGTSCRYAPVECREVLPPGKLVDVTINENSARSMLIGTVDERGP